MVRLQSLSKSFGERTIIQDVSLRIESGERFILLGRSGCGKTTLLRCIAGFETPDKGSIFIEDQNVVSLAVERRPVGFIFQNYALFPHMTVYDNIATGPRVRNLAESEIARRIKELLEITHLENLRDAYPSRLSGGEAQRVALARAIVNRPKILLLDEPLSALDASLRQQLRHDLKELQQALGITFLFVTHDQEEAMSLGTRIGILENGRLLQAGTPTEVYDRPESPFIAGFLGEINRLCGKVEKRDGKNISVSLGNGLSILCESEKRFPPGEEIACLIRPEKMTFSPDPSGKEEQNRLDCEILEKTFYGNFTQYRARVIHGPEVTIPVSHGTRRPKDETFQKGDKVFLHFSPKDVILFEKSLDTERTPNDPRQ